MSNNYTTEQWIEQYQLYLKEIEEISQRIRSLSQDMREEIGLLSGAEIYIRREMGINFSKYFMGEKGDSDIYTKRLENIRCWIEKYERAFSEKPSENEFVLEEGDDND